MDDAGPILDYASPRKRGALRLPATSRLGADVSDGKVTIEESLSGRSEATAALAFAAITFAAVVAAAVTTAYSVTKHCLQTDWQLAFLPALVAVGELVTALCVIHQTWRRTVLTAEYDDLRLAFLSPLHRRRYRWSNLDVADVVILLTANVESTAPLGEVLVTRVAGGDVHLFTDHPAARLAHLARAIHSALRDGRAEPIPWTAAVPLQQLRANPAEPAVPADLAPRAQQMAGRLAEHQQRLRQRRGGPPDQRP